MTGLDDAGRRDRAARAVEQLVWQTARDLLGLGLADPPFSKHETLPDPIRNREVRLAVLSAGRLLAAALDQQIDMDAQYAAMAGADYADLGNAAGITRQGARKRWPGLADTAREARENAGAAAADTGPPPFRAQLHVPNAAHGAIVGHLIAAGYTGREAVQGAAGVHIGMPDRAAAEAIRQRLAEAGYRPGDIIEP